MPPTVFTSVTDLERARGRRVGESAWRTVMQELVEVDIRDAPEPALSALWLTRVVFA